MRVLCEFSHTLINIVVDFQIDEFYQRVASVAISTLILLGEP